MHQLQEQLQINLLQQTHLMQTSSNSNSIVGGNGENNKSGNKTSQAMQQLQIQQQQLISQLQLVQQRLLVVSQVLLTEYWRVDLLYLFQLPNFGNQNQQQQRKMSEDFDAAIPTPKIGQAWKENGNTSPTPKALGSTKSGKEEVYFDCALDLGVMHRTLYLYIILRMMYFVQKWS